MKRVSVLAVGGEEKRSDVNGEVQQGEPQETPTPLSRSFMHPCLGGPLEVKATTRGSEEQVQHGVATKGHRPYHSAERGGRGGDLMNTQAASPPTQRGGGHKVTTRSQQRRQAWTRRTRWPTVGSGRGPPVSESFALLDGAAEAPAPLALAAAAAAATGRHINKSHSYENPGG
jgi:hypothetical protein